MGVEAAAKQDLQRLRPALILLSASTYGFVLTALFAASLGHWVPGTTGGPLLSALGTFGIGVLVWNRFLARAGPRNGMRWAMLGWAVGLLLLAVHPVLFLDQAILHVYAAWLGLHLAGLEVGRWRLRRSSARSSWPYEVMGAVGGAILAMAIITMGLGAHWPHLLFAALTMTVWRLLRDVPDPERPDDPLRRFAPWGDGSGRHWSGFRRFVATPAVLLYLILTWVLFLALAKVEDGILQLPWELTDRYGYAIPELTTKPLSAFTTLITAPLVNHDIIQLVYVTVLLLAFGVVFEAREGGLRFLMVFFIVGAFGALVAGFALHLLYPEVSSHPTLEMAWERTWSGGSAGAFGIMGGLAARARNPWPLLSFFVFWEFNVGWWFLRSYTPAFHVTALLAGFLLVRHGMRPHHPDAPPTSETAYEDMSTPPGM